MQEISTHFAYHEIARASLPNALEKIEAEQHSEREASNLNEKQQRAWENLFLTAAKKGDAYVIRGLYEAEAYSAIGMLTRQSFSLALAAVKHGNTDVLAALVEAGVSLDAKDVDGSTLMHYAVRLDDAPIIEVLYRFGVPLDTMNEFGPPFCTAVYYGNIQAIHVLQKCGVQADQSRDALGFDAMQIAVRREGNIEVIKELYTFGVPAHSDEALFMSAIRAAVHFGHLQNLETILGYMASHDISWPKSVVFWSFDAVWSSNSSRILQLLHGFHVPLDIADSNFEYPDMKAIHLVRNLVEKCDEHTKLNHLSLTHGDFAVQSLQQFTLETMEQLDPAWRAVGTYGCEGQTAMHWAAICGNCNAIQTLRSFEVSLMTEDTAGCTPAHFAALMGHEEVLELFDSLDVPLSSVNYSGFSPADYAKQMGHSAAASYLQGLEE